MAGLLDRATSFQGGPQLQQPSLILSTGPWREENLIAAAESFFQTNAYHLFATCARGHTSPVPMSRKKAAPADRKDTSPRRSIDHFCPHVECNGRDPQHFRSNKSAVRDTTFLEEDEKKDNPSFGEEDLEKIHRSGTEAGLLASITFRDQCMPQMAPTTGVSWERASLNSMNIEAVAANWAEGRKATPRIEPN